MASVNDHMPPPPKQRMSPLEFRNTDLVSRLLAATPPYLYNMSLLPNTFFFSELLRSLVHAKVERSNQMHPPMRRSRKRNWTRSECPPKPSTMAKPEENSNSSSDWMIKSNKKVGEIPLELTTNKPDTLQTLQEDKADSGGTEIEQKPPEIFSNILSNVTQDASNLVLPPPPPMWYPPLYPTAPYGIDPLHFFIDLRVSGHIYDRKQLKDHNLPATDTPTKTYSGNDTPEVISIKNEEVDSWNIFKKPRHCSAFSVPNPSKNVFPVNLSERENRTTKFDVKSMGFDRSSNITSTNYVMKNISSIYKNIDVQREETKNNEDSVEDGSTNEETKTVDDLKALLGLELVVDYMKHKPRKCDMKESSYSTDAESIGSPALEVVALHDEN